MAKYEVKKKYFLIYWCLFLAAGLLFIFRMICWIKPEIKLLPSFLLVHATNLSLSFMVLLAFGFTVLVFGAGMKTITGVSILIAAVNIVYELIFPITHTPDIVDAILGLTGIVLAYIFLLSLKKRTHIKMSKLHCFGFSSI